MIALRLSLILLAALGVAGCSAAADATLASPQVRAALEQRLRVGFAESAPVDVIATLSDVDAVYTARTSNERIVTVVFDASGATRQILGDDARDPGTTIVRRANVVVFYSVTAGTISRLDDVRRALAGVPVT
jgi:hypothetical protein